MKEYTSMQYKTRGNASPQGRPRVFFCCAAADFERLFESITEELLSIRPNAAIWYLAPDEGTMAGEAFLSDLSQMQLLVVPVTTAFLRRDQPDPARTVAFAYAVEHHIPVLPLLQEPGLEPSFNEICGELMALDKTAMQSDPTAVPYEEKLRRFLESVLVSDELARRVRAAFDAYIFLSYRKKDRAAAQRIMRLIHENEFCRDVAIWYDEFLTPGENFNQAISEAMQKSALFAMVVTPNLLENPNYVMTTEFPAARRLEKPILPLEADDTDAAELARLYEGVCDAVQTADLSEVAARLRELLQGIALRGKDDPTHAFLMGIAYLSGIDVEIDHARAVSLITEAGEAGLPEALEKLVSMYKTGEGVERNYRTAIGWQRKLAEYHRKAAELNPSTQNLTQYFWSLIHLGDDLCDVGNPVDAQNVYQESLQCAETMQTQGYAESRQGLYISYERLGTVSLAIGHLEEALVWYQKSLEVTELFAKETNTVDALRGLSVSFGKLGFVSLALDRPAEALGWYQKALIIQETLAKKISTVEVRLDILISYLNLGDVNRALGRQTEALKWYQESLSDATALVRETGAAEVRRYLSANYQRLGGVSDAVGRPEEALGWYQKFVAAVESLAEETGTVEARRDLSVGYERLGNVSLALGRPEEALDWYQRSLAIREVLVAETGTVQARQDLSTSYNKLGDMSGALSHPTEAIGWYQKSLAIRAALVEETGTVEARRDLLISYGKLGDVSCVLGRPGEALVWYQKCLTVAETLVEKSGTVRARRDLSISNERLGDVSRALGRLEEALTWYQKSLAIREALAEETDTAEVQRGLFVSYDRLGDVSCELGRPAEALDCYQKSHAIAEVLAAENETVQALDDLGVSCLKLGKQQVLSRKERRANLICLREIGEQLLKKTGQPRYQQFIDAADQLLSKL